MKKKVLILSSLEDPHAADVAEHLKAFEAQVSFFKFEQFISKYSFNIEIDQNNPLAQLSDRRAAEFDFIDINAQDSIWHRRPGLFKPPVFPEPWITQIVEAEMRTAVLSLFTQARSRWVNRFEADNKCMLKLEQLRIAQQLGFRIPKTLVTNEKQAVLDFYESLQWPVNL